MNMTRKYLKKDKYLQKKVEKLLMILEQYNSIIMEYQKIISLSDNAPIQPSKFWAKNWVEINNDSTPSQALNCDGVVLKIYLDHNFQ